MKTGGGIYRNMEESDTPRYRHGMGEQSLGKDVAEQQMRQLLTELISSSSDLNIRVWLDGVYTNVEDASPKDGWMEGREVYFKVEGRVAGIRELGKRSAGVS
jgi:hypothetical protein